MSKQSKKRNAEQTMTTFYVQVKNEKDVDNSVDIDLVSVTTDSQQGDKQSFTQCKHIKSHDDSVNTEIIAEEYTEHGHGSSDALQLSGGINKVRLISLEQTKSKSAKDQGTENTSVTVSERSCIKDQYIAGSTKSTFPMKLWDLVENDKTILVQWTECGNAIMIDTRCFALNIQEFFPGEFGEQKLRNFCRQLRVYDFNEVTPKDPNWSQFVDLVTMAPYTRIFYHHFFRQGLPRDLVKIFRVRDLIPRGRTRPKPQHPKESLLVPTGCYFIGSPPSSLIEQSNKKLLDDQCKLCTPCMMSKPPLALERPSSALDGPKVVAKDKDLTVSQMELLSKVETQASFCSSLHLNPITDRQKSSSSFISKPAVVVDEPSTTDLDSNDVNVTDSGPKDFAANITINSSTLHLGSSRTPIEIPSTCLQTKPLTTRNIGDKSSLHKQCQSTSGETQQPSSSLVLLPCLHVKNTFLPLTYGSRLSTAGIDFLRQCPEFKRLVEQIGKTRPTMSDRSQQCSPQPTNDESLSKTTKTENPDTDLPTAQKNNTNLATNIADNSNGKVALKRRNVDNIVLSNQTSKNDTESSEGTSSPTSPSSDFAWDESASISPLIIKPLADGTLP